MKLRHQLEKLGVEGKTNLGDRKTGWEFNTWRTGAFKLFKCTFPGSKQFKSTFILFL